MNFAFTSYMVEITKSYILVLGGFFGFLLAFIVGIFAENEISTVLQNGVICGIVGLFCAKAFQLILISNIISSQKNNLKNASEKNFSKKI